MRRRELLTRASSAAILIGLGASGGRADGREGVQSGGAWSGRNASAVVLGRAILRSGAVTESEEGLRRLLGRKLPSAGARLDRAAAAEALAAYAEVIRKDYAAGDLLRVDGLLLSKTEARLCALAALVDDRPLRHKDVWAIG